MKREIVLDGQIITYTVRYSLRVRSIRMTIGLDEGLVVSVSSAWHERFIEGFLHQKSKWIVKHLNKTKKLAGKTVIPHSKKEYEENKTQALVYITERVEFFNMLYHHTYKHISIRNQTSLWGSCTRAGNLQFNYKLMHLPKRTIDYVVVHEVCHLKEHNHSARFWQLVARTMPDYKTIRQSLHNYVMREG